MNSASFKHFIYFFIIFVIMEFKGNSRNELYGEVAKHLYIYMQAKGLNSNSISADNIGISRRQYFHLLKLAKGDDAPEISNKNIKKILDKLNLEMDIEYTIRFKG